MKRIILAMASIIAFLQIASPAEAVTIENKAKTWTFDNGKTVTFHWSQKVRNGQIDQFWADSAVICGIPTDELFLAAPDANNGTYRWHQPLGDGENYQPDKPCSTLIYHQTSWAPMHSNTSSGAWFHIWLLNDVNGDQANFNFPLWPGAGGPDCFDCVPAKDFDINVVKDPL